MEADMKIEEVETNQAATLILADAIEEIQTGDLLLKMILERPPQVFKYKKIQIDKCVMRRYSHLSNKRGVHPPLN